MGETKARSTIRKFFQTVHFLVWNKDNYLKAVKGNTLSNQEYVLVKYIAKKFIPRIRRCFGQGIVAATNTKTPVQDAETLLKLSSKLTLDGRQASLHRTILRIC